MSKFTPQYTYDTFEYNNVQNTTTIGYTLTLPNLLLLNSIFIKIFFGANILHPSVHQT